MTPLSRREVLLGALLANAVAGNSLFSGTARASTPTIDGLGLADLAKLLARGEVTAAWATQSYLALIARYDPALRSVLEVNRQALEQAQALDQQKSPRGPLFGVPILVKDNLDTADGMKTTAGSLALMDAPRPARDSFVVRRLREAGAVLLGKANLSEWANLRGEHSVSGWSARGGQTRNPYSLERNPSGSSSGSAVAVAAGLCAGAIGTETDGSIVSPACSNGLVGLKPTVGLVSRAGIIPISATQDTAGPLTRSVRDAALLLEVIAGPDPLDPVTLKRPAAGGYVAALEGATLKGARLGWWKKLGETHRGVAGLTRDAVKVLRDAGATVVEVDLQTSEWEAAELEVLLFEQKAGLDAYLRQRGGDVDSLAKVIAFNDAHAAQELVHFGQELFLASQAKGPLSSPAYKQALATCGKARRDLDAVLTKHALDAVIAPTGTPAWVTDAVNGDAFGFSSSPIAAVAGTPHLVVPMGEVAGLPVTLSFLGRAFDEAKLLALGHAFEQRTHARRPPKLEG
jgi:amidase